MVELTYKYTEKEYVKAVRQYLIINKKIKKIDIIIIPLLIIVSLFYAISSTFKVYSIVILTMSIMWLLIDIILYFYIPINNFRKTSEFHQEYYLLFSDNGIKAKNENINSELKWETYSKMINTKEFYYLIQNTRMYTFIPKRAFKDEQVRKDFEEMASKHLKIKNGYRKLN